MSAARSGRSSRARPGRFSRGRLSAPGICASTYDASGSTSTMVSEESCSRRRSSSREISDPSDELVVVTSEAMDLSETPFRIVNRDCALFWVNANDYFCAPRMSIFAGTGSPNSAHMHLEALLLSPKTLASEPLFKNNQAKQNLVVVVVPCAVSLEHLPHRRRAQVPIDKRSVVQQNVVHLLPPRGAKPVIHDIRGESAFLSSQNLRRKQILAHLTMQPLLRSISHL